MLAVVLLVLRVEKLHIFLPYADNVLNCVHDGIRGPGIVRASEVIECRIRSLDIQGLTPVTPNVQFSAVFRIAN